MRESAPSAEVQRWFSEVLSRKVGNGIASLLVNIKFLEKSYRKRLSNSYDTPGRVYPFLGTK
ncbi:MAG: hypothetical protein H7Y37_07735 [Anaerolineae bacterium]|nr:hypothetical protein [Gloeobacterales cyanobacterium ES-bin-313]